MHLTQNSIYEHDYSNAEATFAVTSSTACIEGKGRVLLLAVCCDWTLRKSKEGSSIGVRA